MSTHLPAYIVRYTNEQGAESHVGIDLFPPKGRSSRARVDLYLNEGAKVAWLTLIEANRKSGGVRFTMPLVGSSVGCAGVQATRSIHQTNRTGGNP